MDFDGVHTLAGVISHGLSGDSDNCGQVTLSIKMILSVIYERTISVPRWNNGNHFLTASCYYVKKLETIFYGNVETTCKEN